MGPTLAGGAEPGRADRARPSPLNHGPKPDLVCEIPIPGGVGPARPGQRVSNLTGRLPGLARENFKNSFALLFVLCLLLFEVSRSQRARQPSPSGFFGKSLALYNRQAQQSLSCPFTGLRIPLVPRGLRSAMMRHISSHDKLSRIVILVF